MDLMAAIGLISSVVTLEEAGRLRQSSRAFC